MFFAEPQGWNGRGRAALEMATQKSSLVTRMVTEGTFSKFPRNTKLLGATDVLEGRTAIQKDLERLEKLANITPRRRKHQPCTRDRKPPCSNTGSG